MSEKKARKLAPEVSSDVKWENVVSFDEAPATVNNLTVVAGIAIYILDASKTSADDAP